MDSRISSTRPTQKQTKTATRTTNVWTTKGEPQGKKRERINNITKASIVTSDKGYAIVFQHPWPCAHIYVNHIKLLAATM